MPPAEGDSAAVIGVDDVVTIAALNSDEISKAWRVAASGDLTLPILGRVRAAGLTEAQLEQELTIRLKEFVRVPQVTVFISEFHGHPATVSGAVEKPGVVQLKGSTTLFEALVLAGGPKEAGPTDQATIVDARSHRRTEVILRVPHFIARSRPERRADVHRHGTRKVPIVDRDMRAAGLVLVWPHERPYSGWRARLIGAVRIEARPGRPACIGARPAVP